MRLGALCPFKGGIEKSSSEDRSELFPGEGVAGVLSCGCQRPHLPPADVSLGLLLTDRDKSLCSKLENIDFTAVAVYGLNDTLSIQ